MADQQQGKGAEMEVMGDAKLPEAYADEAMKEVRNIKQLSNIPPALHEQIKEEMRKAIRRAMNDETADCTKIAQEGKTPQDIARAIHARITRRQDESIERKRA